MGTMKRLVLGAVIALSLGMGSPAYADHGGYRQGDECGRNGGCDNHRRENYGDNSCKYVCPAFDKSPVQDSFNFDPQVCLPGATCYFEDRKKNQEQQPK